MKMRPPSPAFARAVTSFATFDGNVSAPGRYSMPASVVFEKTNRRSGFRAAIEAALHAVDLFDLLDHLAVLHAAQDHVVQAALLIDHVAHALRERLYDLHGGIEHAGFVHAVDHPVDERAQEIALAELEDADGAGQRCFTGQLFHVMCSFQSSETR